MWGVALEVLTGTVRLGEPCVRADTILPTRSLDFCLSLQMLLQPALKHQATCSTGFGAWE